MPGAYDHEAGCDTGRPRCGKPARFYAGGWRCDEHRPRTYRYTAPTKEPTQ
ncbi:hypothetical protein [Streptomyces nogalater]|uniref:Uncharacterized protein n=1 Tax=Streptomyces nogalater TaxID=38314 RepID=A0ABW0WAM3_STRNO